MNLPAVSRADRLLLGIILVAATLAALAAWLLRAPEKTGGMFKLPSTFYNAGYGTKAFYLSLDRLDFPMTRLRRPLVPDTLGGIGTLFVLQPATELESHELTDLLNWVRSGHALVVVPGSSFENRLDRGSLAAWFHLTEASSSKDSDETALGDTATEAHAAVGEKLPTGDKKIDATDPIMAGVGELAATGKMRFRADSPCRGPLAGSKPNVFWKDEQGVLGLRIQYGEGEIIAMADTYPLTNLGISRADNGLLSANIVRRLSEQYPGQVAFDEYHLGFPHQDSSPLAMVQLILAGNWRWPVVQILFVATLALAAGAVRFGCPRDVTHKPRRHRREFAEAAGRLLDEAGATTVAAETLFRHYRGQICRLSHIESEADDDRLASAVRNSSELDIAGILQEARAATKVPVGRQKLLAISKELYHIVETLAHGT